MIESAPCVEWILHTLGPIKQMFCALVTKLGDFITQASRWEAVLSVGVAAGTMAPRERLPAKRRNCGDNCQQTVKVRAVGAAGG